MTIQNKLIIRAGKVSLATQISRVLGFIRDMLIASRFGTGIYAVAFIAAFRIPNLFRRLFGEGALSASFIPIFTNYLQHKTRREAWNLALAVGNLLILVLLGITCLGILGAPFIARVIVPGFTPEKIEITTRLLRILFPYLFFIGLAALAMSILNSFKQFFLPAATSIVLNIAIIITLLFFIKAQNFSGVRILCFGVLLGGAGQLLIQVPALLKQGMPLRIMTVFRHKEVKKIILLMGPAALGLAVYQINVVVDTFFASYENIVGEGAIAALYFGNRLVQFPLAIFGIAMATAVFPMLAGQASRMEMGKLKETLSFSLRTVFYFIIPASVGLVILRKPIIILLFQRNAFSVSSVEHTALALFYYSLGLFAYAGIHITSRAFYSLQDTKTPAKTASWALLLNIALNLVLMQAMGLGGLALATSLSAIVNFGLLLYFLSKKIDGLPWKNISFSLARTVLISLFMGIACYFSLKFLGGDAAGETLMLKCRQVFIPLLVGMGTLVIISSLFKFEEFRVLARIILGKK